LRFATFILIEFVSFLIFIGFGAAKNEYEIKKEQ
jgi:hypothetical protein